MQVAKGIFQVQLPLPFPLRIVNCYVLRDGDGFGMFDPQQPSAAGNDCDFVPQFSAAAMFFII